MGVWEAMGSRSVKHAPRPSSDSTSIVPPCAFMIRWLTNRPSPVPAALVVKKGSKIYVSLPAGIPAPLSITWTCT